MNKIFVGGMTILVNLVMSTGAAFAAPPSFGLQPFEFVGTAAECGGTAGTDTVTAKWDNTTGNPSPSIFLQKLGATTNCAAAGVDIITPLEGGSISALNELNFDYKIGGHCGAGAPRFNVQVSGNTYFLGCTQGTHTPAATGWEHVVFGSTDFIAAGIPLAGTLEDLYIIFDEGTDTPTGGTIGTAGTVNIDNISVNNNVVGSPTSATTKDDCKNGGWQNFINPTFKNQGDCVSYIQSNPHALGNKNK